MRFYLIILISQRSLCGLTLDFRFASQSCLLFVFVVLFSEKMSPCGKEMTIFFLLLFFFCCCFLFCCLVVFVFVVVAFFFWGGVVFCCCFFLGVFLWIWVGFFVHLISCFIVLFVLWDGSVWLRGLGGDSARIFFFKSKFEDDIGNRQ